MEKQEEKLASTYNSINRNKGCVLVASMQNIFWYKLAPVWDVLWHLHLQRLHMDDLYATIHPISSQYLTGQFIHRLRQLAGVHLSSSCLLCTHTSHRETGNQTNKTHTLKHGSYSSCSDCCTTKCG